MISHIYIYRYTILFMLYDCLQVQNLLIDGSSLLNSDSSTTQSWAQPLQPTLGSSSFPPLLGWWILDQQWDSEGVSFQCTPQGVTTDYNPVPTHLRWTSCQSYHVLPGSSSRNELSSDLFLVMWGTGDDPRLPNGSHPNAFGGWLFAGFSWRETPPRWPSALFDGSFDSLVVDLFIP